MASEWVVRRASNLADIGEAERHNLGFRARMEEHIAGSLQQAIERGKAEQDKAVAAERERTLDAVIQAFEKGRGDVIARLENPDEALIEAVHRQALNGADAICRALARTLTESQEGENTDG